MTKLMVFDGSLHLYRMAYQAKTILENEVEFNYTDKDLVNLTVSLAIKSLVSLLRKESRPVFVILLFDKYGSTSYRRAINPGYKGNREKNETVLSAKSIFFSICSRLPILCMELDNLEADDIAYAMSRDLRNSIKFVTNDWDWLSCIAEDPTKFLYRPIERWTYSLNDFYNWYYLILDNFDKSEWYKLYPKIVLLKKAILGDSSDNVEGFEGIGEKRSNNLITQLLQLDNYSDILNVKFKQSYEKNFQDNFKKFEDNIKVLGYGHIPQRILHEALPKAIEDKMSEYDHNIESTVTDIATQLNSSYMKENLYDIIEILETQLDYTPELRWRDGN